MSADDELRAALWREQQRRRVQFQAELWKELAGDPDALAALRADWQPVMAWMLERDEPGYPGDEDPAVDPMGLGDTVNVGT